MNQDTLVARSLASVWHPCTQMKRHEADPPVAIASARGPWLHGTDGRRYLDGITMVGQPVRPQPPAHPGRAGRPGSRGWTT